MLKRKKSLIALLTATIISYSFISVNATDEVPLTVFGTDTPVYMYNHAEYGHGEQVMVPAQFEHQKEEHRATWVSTVFNIDFPQISSEAEFIEEFKTIIQNSKDFGLNSIVFQVRPMLDAWYQSEINPSSAYINGTQGAELSYDPLAIAIDLSHEAGMELHAWFNPYRVTNYTTDYRSKEEKLSELDDMNFAKQNPDLVYEFANKLYLDPGHPDVVAHIEASIKEVVDNYDIDAVHFDDYFYPYKTSYIQPIYDADGQPLLNADGKPVDSNGDLLTSITETMRDRLDLDTDTFANYDRGFDDVHVWREDNINTLIKAIDSLVDTHNKETGNSVQFGISPFGIWDHKIKNEDGSYTPSGSTASLDDYVDTREWVHSEWVDYLTPQIYWQFNQPAAPYGNLVEWWNTQFEGINESHLYIGHANYKTMQGWQADFANPDEIPSQLRFNQKYENVQGSSFFSYKQLLNNSTGSSRDDVRIESNNIVSSYYSVKALPPAKPWLDQKETSLVYDVSIENSESGAKLTWSDDENNDTQFYVIYRQEGDTVDITNPENILEIIDRVDGISQEFIDTANDNLSDYTYAITILDKAKVETEPVIAVVPGTEEPENPEPEQPTEPEEPENPEPEQPTEPEEPENPEPEQPTEPENPEPEEPVNPEPEQPTEPEEPDNSKPDLDNPETSDSSVLGYSLVGLTSLAWLGANLFKKNKK